jgi:hypothetical protein
MEKFVRAISSDDGAPLPLPPVPSFKVKLFLIYSIFSRLRFVISLILSLSLLFHLSFPLSCNQMQTLSCSAVLISQSYMPVKHPRILIPASSSHITLLSRRPGQHHHHHTRITYTCMAVRVYGTPHTIYPSINT